MNNFDRAEKACYDRLKRAKKDTKTDREIELEKRIKELEDDAASIARGQALVDEFGDYEVLIEYIAGLKKKLEIAVKALKFYANENNFAGESSLDYVYEKHPTSDCIDDFCDMGWYAQQALKEIEG